jgi:pimeloyl-ACP methyl ester carboxylesterase
VMVHGLPTSPALWRHVMPRIRDSRCLAWELVGYGSSIPQGSRCDLLVARQAGYLLDWLTALRIKRAVLVDHDLGGVVQIAAAQQPRICAGLVLINSIGYDAWPVPTVKLARRLSVLAERLPRRLFRLAFRRFMRLAHTSRDQATKAFAVCTGRICRLRPPRIRTAGA